MAKVNFKNGRTSVILRVKILDSTSTTGAAKTGLTSASSGLIISTIADLEATATAYTAAGSTIETITTLGTFAAPTATKCRFKEVDATNHPGLYEIQIADARWAVSNANSVIVTVSGATGAAQVDAEIQLEPVPANVKQWRDTNAAAPTTAGYPAVEVVYPAGLVTFSTEYVAGSAATDFAAAVLAATPAETSGRATTFGGMLRRLWEGRHNKRTRNRTTGVFTIRNDADSADLETSTQSTASGVDTQTEGA